MTGLEQARAVADTILYEGYVLYPYRASAQKNRERFQFGVLMPPAYTRLDPSEHTSSRTECLLECGDEAGVRVFARFLQIQRRTRPDGESWDEAVEHEHERTVHVDALARGPVVFHLAADAAQTSEAAEAPETPETAVSRDERAAAGGPVTRRREALTARLTVHADRVAGPYRLLKLCCVLENMTEPPSPTAVQRRSDALPYALVSAHLLLEAPGCRFVSMTDPPRWAAAEAAACRNERTWPVLAGPPGTAQLLLSSPVILYDHPRLAPESPGDLYDATEIDEILTLRTLALTDAEKAQARATDPRAAAIVERVDALPPELLDRLHGTVRYLRAVTEPAPAGVPDPPWWDPEADASVSPQTDEVTVRGVPLRKGSRVLMRPGARRADAQDMFLAGRPAVIEAVLTDVDGRVHLAVTPQDDPAAQQYQRHGRHLYFAPDEIEPIGGAQ
ncbi:hypothetical protein KGA66_00420 [Actinocrinis puniceicyclus]|uniref:Uncharacterized protein n=1 Tax=Actinocrinis puniceicyclus TaxID=977794 RepID=A0A8J7WHM0_9ACTN|nr:hypothetical protein [Actinocrinis puniceicyclus]MBS2961488.1 hypothetical protein [Actinocrinis puniceicyclus]